MALKLVNEQTTTLQTTSTGNNRINRINMRNQVAQSKGTEWMVNSYIAWQQRSPLANEPKRKATSMRLVGGMSFRQQQLRNVMGISVRVIVLLMALFMFGLVG